MQSVNSWLSIQIPFASTALIRAEPIRFAGRRLNAPVSQGSARLLTYNTATCLIMVRLAIRFGQSIPAIRVSFRLRLVSSHGLPTVRSRLVWSSPITYLPKRIKMPSPFPTGPVSSSHAQSSHALSRDGIPSQDQIT